MSSVDSTSDDRTANNVMRHEYRILSDEEKAQMRDIKDLGAQFFMLLTSIERIRGTTRELNISKVKIEEATMWAVKEITR